MYKVFIVDDEPIIREGLKKIINWDGCGFKIVGEAGDGLEAFEKISKLKPDLCIIDIKMPEIDGLELISKIKEIKNDTKILILTGYPEFDYAQRAIDLGVEGYILKPVDPEILLDKLNKLYIQLEKEKILLENSKERILEKLLKGYLELNDEEVNRIFNLNLPWKSYQVILIYSEKERDCYRIFKELLRFFSFCFIVEGRVGVVIEDFVKERRKLLTLKNFLKNKFEDYFIFSVGNKVSSIKQINCSYKTALSLLQKRFLYENKGFLISSERSCLSNLKGSFDFKDKIIKAIESFDFIALDVLLEEKMRLHIANEDEEHEIKLSYFDLYINVITSLSFQYSKFKDFSEKYLKKRIFDEFYNKKTLLDLHNYIKDLFLDVFKDFSEIVGSSPFWKIAEYIEANYYKDLKLKNIAREFGYNPCYLGKIFKKYTGEKFNTFLDKVRICKAKDLLISGMKVVDVAEKVGYKDLDYFVYKFKKYTGKSPQSFKEERPNNL